MTSPLERAFEEISALPKSELDWVAQLPLDTLRDEREWDRQFAESQAMLDSLGKKHWPNMRLDAPENCESIRCSPISPRTSRPAMKGCRRTSGRMCAASQA